jgi:hypothetical protein
MSLRNQITRLATIAVVAGGTGLGLVVTGAPALACVPDPSTGQCVSPHVYYVSGTDGTLAEQSNPRPGNVVGWLKEGAAVNVLCQINDGGTTDGIPSHTWDELAGGAWVFDHYITTPAQDGNGWSAGVPHCGPPALSLALTKWTTPAPGKLVVIGRTAGPLFNDGPGFTNANRAESLSAAEASGFCQDVVMANTDYSFLWPDLNFVARWPQDARNNGMFVTTYPVVGAVVVFNGGWHGGWNYDNGHVAMVMQTFHDGTFTVAEFNWNADGGGRYVLDIRHIASNDDAAAAFIR